MNLALASMLRQPLRSLSLLLLCALCTSCNQYPPPKAQGGVLDLRQWDFQKPVSLDGEWRVTWNELVAPDDIQGHLMESTEVPGSWGKTYSAPSVATYHLTILLPEGIERLALNTGTTFNSQRIYWNRKLLYQQGKPGLTPADTVPKIGPKITFTPTDTATVQLTMHVANHRNNRTGIFKSPTLGKPLLLFDQLRNQTIYDITIIAALLALGLYHLIVFLWRRDFQGHLALGIACWGLALFFSTLGVVSIQILWPSVEWSVIGKLTFFGWAVSAPMLIPLIEELVPEATTPKTSKKAISGLLLMCLTGLLLPHSILRQLYPLFQLATLVPTYFLIKAIVEAFKLGRLSVVEIVVILTASTLLSVNDILNNTGVINTGFLLPYYAFILVVRVGIALSQRVTEAQEQALRQSRLAATAHREALDFQKTLSDNLQGEVDRQTIELRNRATELERANEQKTAFFQNISHELRTPLTLILNPLEKQRQNQPDNRDINVAVRNSYRLLRLVNQLLDFQKFQANRQQLHLEPIAVNRFLMACNDYFEASTSARNIRFTVSIAESIGTEIQDVFVQAEVDALEKIIFNFLSNALKFTPNDGEIELGASYSQLEVQFYVKDTGPGIAPEERPKLFRVFSQLDDSTTRAHEGTGLGLALTKELAEAMHGSVGVDSVPGEGSTFWCKLPRAEMPASEMGDYTIDRSWLVADTASESGAFNQGRLPDSVEAASGSLVLIVDDLPDMRAVIASALQEHGYRTAEADNGEVGFQAVVRLQPDIIITDWMMPKLSGPGLIELVRKDQDHSGTPIVLLTAKSDEESKLMGTQIGADAFLGKPFNEAELVSVVRNLLALKENEKRVAAMNQYLTETVLKRYLPPTLVQEIVDGKLQMQDEAHVRPITVLFADLVGFTRFSEQAGPEAVATLLNEHLSTMTQVVFEYGGTIDKFIGDAIMVFFGAPKDMDPSEQQQRAVSCAQAMQKASRSLSSNSKAQHLAMRIGIHHGPAVVGNFGSHQRSDYTCIGPTVNLASRIESTCEPGQVYVSRVVAQTLPQWCEEAGRFNLKGVEGAQLLYRLVD